MGLGLLLAVVMAFLPKRIEKLKEENKALYDIVTNRIGRSESPKTF
jgi:hypothetical protein